MSASTIAPMMMGIIITITNASTHTRTTTDWETPSRAGASEKRRATRERGDGFDGSGRHGAGKGALGYDSARSEIPGARRRRRNRRLAGAGAADFPDMAELHDAGDVRRAGSLHALQLRR